MAQSFRPYKEVLLYKNKVATWKIEEDGNTIYTRVADYMDVKKVVENLDSGEMSVLVEYCDSTTSDEMKELEVSLGEIATRAKIMNLASKGLDVNEANAAIVIKHLRNQRESVEKSKIHCNLGFFQKGERYFFKNYNIVGASKEEDINSEYKGSLQIKSKGDRNKWLDMINSEVIGRPALELALAIGFSAPVVGFIGNDIAIESPLVHLYGDSTQGKTTAAMLAVSAFGSPNIRDRGLLMTWNTTANAMHGSISGNTGFPIVFDESSMANRQDFTKEIYSLTAGKDKVRMDKESNLKEQKVWNTTIISTGEHSIFTKSKANTGIRMRLLEFGNIIWTESAKHSELIKETVIENYGHYGQVFARMLLKLGKSRVIAMHKECKEELAGKLKESPFKERIAAKLSVLMVAARILKENLDIDLNLEEIEKQLVLNEADNFENNDISEKAYDLLIQKVVENGRKFERFSDNPRADNSPAIDRETWGIIEKTGRGINEEAKIIILVDIFNKLLKENGFEEPKVILRKWKDKGMLDNELNKFTRRRKIGDMEKVACYVIKVNKEELENKAAVAQPTVLGKD